MKSFTSPSLGVRVRTFGLSLKVLCFCAIIVISSCLPTDLEPKLENSGVAFNSKAVHFGSFGNKVYYTSEASLRLTHSEADAYCRINGGMRLVSVESQPEQDYLKDTIIDAEGAESSFFWTGAKQKPVQMQHFYWEESGVTMGFHAPNYYSYYYHYGLCIVMGAERGAYSYRADQCDHLHAALCQQIV